MINRFVIWLVETLSHNNIRGQHYFKPFKPSLRWWWIKGMKTQYDGWITF